ncbi:hypothetical protein JR316_0008761 [Psilocybe cubensis]|uniref:Uncharacterized protein n=2 Tax=Psilocybe cubensis TaxID=181762 RepID=A0ACB8GRD0_PSICU|nr:hypothetical protein JR316_0008761 [Psilocybe cubensis]KAH9478308.1 hypothetical protein JR316_0008761 [Psilocybe cubensis]
MTEHHPVPGQSQNDALPSEAYWSIQACKMSNGSCCSLCSQYQNLHEQVTLPRKRQLRTEINRHHDPISRFLPYELISKIFKFYVEDDFRDLEEQKDWRNFRITNSPLIIASICSTWRSVAMSSPQLWTHIQMILQEFCRPLDKLDVLNRWISSAGNQTVSLFVVCEAPKHIPDRRRTQYKRVIAGLNAISHRWRILRLSCSHAALYQMFSGNVQGMPNLCGLSIENSIEPDYDDRVVFRTDNGHKPRPCEVRLIRVPLICLDIIWNQVTRINISQSELSLNEWRELMRQASQLLECELTDIFFAPVLLNLDMTMPKHPKVGNHTLRKVKIGQCSGDLEYFFTKFSAPNLTQLLLEKAGSVKNWNSIRTVVEASGPQLTTLGIIIHADGWDYVSLLSLLSNTPVLEDLRINAQIRYDPVQLFHIIAKSSTLDVDIRRPQILPVLRSFRYQGYKTWDGSFWEFLPYFINRSDPENPCSKSCPLDSLELTTWDDDYRSKKENVLASICPSREVVHRISLLSSSGTTIRLIHNDIHILAASIRHHCPVMA